LTEDQVRTACDKLLETKDIPVKMADTKLEGIAQLEGIVLVNQRRTWFFPDKRFWLKVLIVIIIGITLPILFWYLLVYLELHYE
jgi:hypothetical protein